MNGKNHFDLIFSVLIVAVLWNNVLGEPKTRTPARILAKQTGATQFEEERYEANPDCNEHKHHLKKRASDEDVDYEVYQGVVGRPGIDFPIYPRIPKTSFSCRTYGNGYFADMETDCQVFHICEEGRKISFLCPNGTIFHQSELTCDWWFKVNCLGSSGYYAESAEILNKQRVQRIRPSVPVKGFNIVGGGLNLKPKLTSRNENQDRQSPKSSERRIDSNEESVVENVDFDDVSGEKGLKGSEKKQISNIETNSNDETQITAESGSFVTGKRRNGLNDNDSGKGVSSSRQRENGNRRTNHNDRNNPRPNFEVAEKARSGNRGRQRYREGKKPLVESLERAESEESRESLRKVLPEKIINQPANGSGRSNEFSSIKAEDDVRPDFYETTRSSSRSPSSTTPYYSSGTYSTAKKFETTRVTPYYTPTVPTVSKVKSTEGKAFYVKSIKNSNSASVTTPNPNRVSNGASLFFESSSKASKPSTKSSSSFEGISTLKPYVIGLRHYTEPDSEISSVSIRGNNQEEILTTTTTPPTGPTYLPKSSNTPKALKKTADAAGTNLLFAPSPALDDSVSRNVDEMLKTITLIKTKLNDAEQIKTKSQGREGLDIPPSSGPDALVSLAKYFATETSKTAEKVYKALENTSREKKTKNDSKPALGARAGAGSGVGSGASTGSGPLKPSDTIATITTTAIPNIALNADDIEASLLSEKTVAKYSNLFGLKEPKARQQSADVKSGLLSNTNSAEGKGNAFNLFPQIGSTDPTISNLAEKPESRKIAQVFSNALNTYLENPENFRARLASIRPTEPPSSSSAKGRSNYESATANDVNFFKSGTAASYLPTQATTFGYDTTTSTTTSTSTSIAAEINSKFDFSTLPTDLASTTESYEATTIKTNPRTNIENLKLELSAELIPPSLDSGEGEEILQREHTQSFVKSRNHLTHSQKDSKKPEKLTSTTDNPWSHISHADFLDPLTINDGLMKDQTTTTLSPFTYLPKESTTAVNRKSNDQGHIRILSGASQRLVTGSQSFQVSPRNNLEIDSNDNWKDILESYDIPHEALPSSTGLQRIANKLFGGLDENEALHLKNVMAQAEHNRQVLSLLLLLIQTCDDQNGKALERSRKHLLNALIDMDSKLSKKHDKPGKNSYQKDVSRTTTNRVPVTTYRRNNDDYVTSTLNYPSTTSSTDIPSTTVTETTTPNTSIEETTKFEIHVPDLDDETYGSTTTIRSSGTVPPKNGSNASNTNSDKRALELLKSLYSLASKFTSRR